MAEAVVVATEEVEIGLDLRGVGIDDDRDCAFGDAGAGDGETDALAAAGDEDDLFGEAEVHKRGNRGVGTRE